MNITSVILDIGPLAKENLPRSTLHVFDWHMRLSMLDFMASWHHGIMAFFLPLSTLVNEAHPQSHIPTPL